MTGFNLLLFFLFLQGTTTQASFILRKSAGLLDYLSLGLLMAAYFLIFSNLTRCVKFMEHDSDAAAAKSAVRTSGRYSVLLLFMYLLIKLFASFRFYF